MTGPHRSVAPETTLARLLPLFPALGITRLGMLTGLDVVGVPVAAAYRPNSRSVAVHQGKALSVAAAKVSAAMEAVECFHAENFDGPLRLGSAAEVGRHGEVVWQRLPRALAVNADPAAFSSPPALAGGEGQGEGGDSALIANWTQRSGRSDPPHPTLSPQAGGRGKQAIWEGIFLHRILWTQARDLASGRNLFIPYELVSADFSVPAPPGFGIFQQTTNGLGAGNRLVEAILHGLYETIERDAVARWHAANPAEQAARAVDPATVEGPASTALLARLAAAGVQIRLWDITAETALPAYLALAWDRDGIAGIEPESGAGCHASADLALARALAEAAQARLTRISGARDDFAPASYVASARAARQDAAERLSRAAPARRFRPLAAAATPEADLDTALAALARSGCAQVACVELTRPDIGIPVAKIVVPGLRGPVEE